MTILIASAIIIAVTLIAALALSRSAKRTDESGWEPPPVTHGEPILAYVAGKFSGNERAEVERNIRAAEAVGIELARAGFVPVVPHSNTSAPEYEDVQPYNFWIKATLELMRRCDIVVCVDNWRDSSGAKAEVAEQMRLGKPVFLSVADAIKWRDSLS